MTLPGLDLRILRTGKGRDLRQSSGQRAKNLYPYYWCVKQIALLGTLEILQIGVAEIGDISFLEEKSESA